MKDEYVALIVTLVVTILVAAGFSKETEIRQYVYNPKDALGWITWMKHIITPFWILLLLFSTAWSIVVLSRGMME